MAAANSGMQHFAAQMASMQLASPVQYYVQAPQMYYPPSAYAYPGGMMPNAPTKEQVEDAVRKQVPSPLSQIALWAKLTCGVLGEDTWGNLSAWTVVFALFNRPHSALYVG